MSSIFSISQRTEIINTPDDILAKLKVAKEEGNGKYTCFCPVHDERMLQKRERRCYL